jgi:hypothetical protein
MASLPPGPAGPQGEERYVIDGGQKNQARLRLLESLVAVEGVEQSAVQYRLKPTPQSLQLEHVSRSELNLDPEPTILARRREERSRQSRSPHRAPLRRIGLRMHYLTR